MIVLVPMAPDEFAGYRLGAAEGYANDNVASGRWPGEGAFERSLADFDSSLPTGLATPDNYLFEIRDTVQETSVGNIWFAVVEKNGLYSAFVYDVEIKESFRRRGYAEAAFLALERHVRGLGLTSIGLHVFSQNPGAQALYQKLGYEVTSVNMRKALEGGSTFVSADTV